MSQRLKRQQSRAEDASVPSKRRKGRASPRVQEDEPSSAQVALAAYSTPLDCGSGDEMDDGAGQGTLWTPRPISDLKISSIYNRSAPEAPAELFRKDLISAMKLPDSEPLAADEYWLISDPWKQDWERGVQVPVNPDSLPEPSVTVISQSERSRLSEFKLPKNKYLRITGGEGFSTETHHLSNVPTEADRACAYDLDDCDLAWLSCLNGERALMGLSAVREEQLERVLEEMEVRCWKKIQSIVRSEEGLGIEFDEDVICDVCRSPDSEEGNEMVFCDSCDICVHQACYGITTIPAGSWLCRTCALSQAPECVLCPNRGGAMKCTHSGKKWAHVSCALWIPEVSIGCVERMEPITKISSIPQSRWALVCVLCRERVGACIQCSVKTCKTAYHVTCAFKHKLEMRAIIEDEKADDGVKLKSYCQKHSVTNKKDKSSTTAVATAIASGSEDEEGRRRKRKELTSEERSQAKAAKLQEIEAEFDKHLTLKDLPAQHLDVDHEAIVSIYNYWKLKRKAGRNRPLIAPRTDDIDMLGRAQVQADQEKMRMFVQLRQDLERVRNLCYMVSRREKLSRSFFRIREQTFHKQVSVITTLGSSLNEEEHAAIIQANHGPSIYDRLYSVDVPDPFPDVDDLIARITGKAKSSSSSKTSPLNGLLKRPPGSPLMDSSNPYKRTYFNGATRTRSNSLSMSSGSDSDIRKSSKMLGVRSDSSADEAPLPPTISKKNVTTKSSSSLQKMEKELTDRSSVSGESSSDELISLPKSSIPARMQLKANIYSDSEEEDDRKKLVRTKAEVKEFTPVQAKKVSPNGKAVRGRKPKRKLPESSKNKVTADPTELIVPQRQAAKKATESIRHSTAVRTKEPGAQELSSEPTASIVTAKSEEPIKKKKVRSSGDIYDFEKDITGDAADILAYVPQRQAAKKAAEHIKGLGKPGELVAATTTTTTTVTTEETKKSSKIDKFKPRSTLSSSESDVEDEKEKAKRIQRSVFGKVREGRGSGGVPVSDRPFLDKGFDSDAETHAKPAPTKRDNEIRRRIGSSNDKKLSPTSVVDGSSSGSKKGKQTPSKKLKTSERRPESKFQQPPNTSTTSAAASSATTVSSTSKPTTATTATGERGIVPRGKKRQQQSAAGDEQRRTSPAKDRVPTSIGRSGDARRSRDSSTSSSTSSSSSDGGGGSTSSGSSSSGNSSSTSGSSSSGSSSSSSDSSSESEDEKRSARIKESSTIPSSSTPVPPAAAVISVTSQTPTTATTTSKKQITGSTTTLGKTTPPTKRDKGRERESLAVENKNQTTVRKQSPQPSIKKAPQKEMVVQKKSPERETSPTKRPLTLSPITSPRRRPSITTKSDAVTLTPKKLEKTPQKDSSTPKRESSTPKRESSTPKREANTPKREPTPRRDSGTPKREMSTPRRDSTSRTPRRDSTPRRNSTKSNKEAIIVAEKIDDDQENTTPPKKVSGAKPMPKSKKKDLGILSDTESEESSIQVLPSKKTAEPVEEPLLLSASPPPSSAAITSSRVTPITQQRSIFSPPHQKDQELYDFAREILAVDETMARSRTESTEELGNQPNVTSDGEARSSMPPPLSFSFSNEFLFKVDSKEDSERETRNLVEKLRSEYAKKSVPDGEGVEEMQPPPTPLPERREEEPVKAPTPPPMPTSTPYAPLEVKVGPPERDKMDQSHGAQADERWVPPSPMPQQTTAPPIPSPIPPPSIPEIPPASERPPSTPADYMARKWAESEMLISRRSSSSSGSSTASSSSHRDDALPPHSQPVLPPTPLGEITGYMPLPNADTASLFYAYPPHSIDPSTYVHFPPYSIPHATPYTAVLPPQLDEAACSGAAFTSSQQNMALTAALMSPGATQNAAPPFRCFPPQPQPSPVPSEPPPPPTPPNFIHTQVPIASPPQPSTPTTPLPCSVSEPPTPPPAVANHKPPTPVKQVDFVTPQPPPPPSAAVPPHPGKKSPSKPTRSSTRVIPKPATPKLVAPQSPRPRERKPNRGTYNTRGRGKGRGGKGVNRGFIKGAQVPQKLQGTVYDFDVDEFDAPPTPGVENLRAMRERRRSTDVHRYEESIYNDSRSDEGSFVACSPPAPQSSRSFPDVVQPLLPGPVDMRTYSGGSYTSPAAAAAIVLHPEIPVASTGLVPDENTLENQNQLLGSFANAEPHPVSDLDDLEKEIHALEASRPEHSSSSMPSPKQTVTLQESRNQLKVKIKGPFLDANYASATPVVPTVITDPSPMPMPQSSMSSSGPSNLRRMRKKELLRQYVTQNMNTQETGSPAPVAAAPTPVSRAVITIPKAVASMTSIPTREDYKAVVDANMEKKRRKGGGGVTSDDMESGQTSSSLMLQKKRGRPKVMPTVTSLVTSAAPKLKIRLGSLSPSTESEDRRLLRERPPKKRLSATVHVPTVEELKRESMKFRKKIMADFDSQESKRDKKKKQRDDVSNLNCIVLDASANVLTANNTSSTSPEEKSAPKLIIRIGKRPMDLLEGKRPRELVTTVSDTPPPSSEELGSEPTPTNNNNNNNSTTPTTPSIVAPTTTPPPSTSEASETVLKVRTSKVTPIRLKLSRCEEGYVASKQEGGTTKDDATTNEPPTVPPPVAAGCEVR